MAAPRKKLSVPRTLAVLLVAAPLAAAGCRDDEVVPVDAAVVDGAEIDALDATEIDAIDARMPIDADGGSPFD